MFAIRTALLNLRRYRIKTMLNILICVMVVLFVNIYTGSLEKSREQFFGLSDKIPVEATIMTLNGSQESGMYIREELYDKIRTSEYVKDAQFTLELAASLEAEPCRLLAADTWEGYEEFLSSNRRECIVSSEFAERKQLKEGDEILLSLASYEPEPEQRLYYETKPLGDITFEVVEVDKAGTNEEEAKERSVSSDILIPLLTARDIYRSADLDFHVSSGSFYVKNGLELNGFKKAMDDLGFLEVTVQAMGKVDGNALLVRDQTFIQAAGSLAEGYKAIKMFVPVICMALAVAGFITSYLLMAGRRQEYILMRSLGMTKNACACSYLTEQGMCQLLGGLTGSVLAAVVAENDLRWRIAGFAAFFVCFILGTVIAVRLLGRKSMINSVAQAD